MRIRWGETWGPICSSRPAGCSNAYLILHAGNESQHQHGNQRLQEHPFAFKQTGQQYELRADLSPPTSAFIFYSLSKTYCVYLSAGTNCWAVNSAHVTPANPHNHVSNRRWASLCLTNNEWRKGKQLLCNNSQQTRALQPPARLVLPCGQEVHLFHILTCSQPHKNVLTAGSSRP